MVLTTVTVGLGGFYFIENFPHACLFIFLLTDSNEGEYKELKVIPFEMHNLLLFFD